MTRDNLGAGTRTRHWNMLVFAAVVGVLAFVAPVGTAAAETLNATDGPNTIDGRGGDDTLLGKKKPPEDFTTTMPAPVLAEPFVMVRPEIVTSMVAPLLYK